MRLLFLSALLPLLSSPILGQTTATYRAGLTSGLDPRGRQPAPPALTLGTQLRPLELERRNLSDSTDTGVWRRFRRGAAAGFAMDAGAGLAVQSRADGRAT